MAEPLGFKKAAVGRKANLAKLGQIVQPLADAEIPGVVDGGFGPQGALLFMVLFDPRGLVMDVQRWRDAFGNNAGAERAGRPLRDAALEDELHVLGAADVQVLADHLFEENAAMNRPVKNLGC